MSTALARHLIAALALTAALTAGTQGAVARVPRDQRADGCTITAEAVSSVVGYGEPATIAGTVACLEAQAAGQVLTV